jgi:hypothetical protein
MIARRFKIRFAAALVPAALLAAALAAPGAARADRIDGELMKQVVPLVDHLKANKAKYVAVLKFRASRDDARPDFHTGPINNIMADRLENTLILGHNVDPDWAIDVAHNASAVAANKGMSYLPAAKAKELFDLKYPDVATGNKKTPDLFLTGEIHFDTKKHTTTVVLQSFTKEHPELSEVARFTVPTERNTVAESGRSFVINRSLAERDAGPDKDEAKDKAGAAADEAAQEQAAKAAREQQQNAKAGADKEEQATKNQAATDNTTQAVKPVATPDRFVDLRVLYNDEDVPLEPDARDPANRAFTRDPKVGDTVKFLLTNRSPNRVAVALLVNGVNTVKDEMGEPLDCTKWILEPNKNLIVEGFYNGVTGRNNVKPFRVMTDEESDDMFERNQGPLRNEKLGTISLHVFVEGQRPMTPADVAVTRGLSPSQYKKEVGQAKSIDDLSKLLYAAADKGKKDRLLSRGLIADDGKVQDGSKLIPEEFKNATEVQHLLVRYYDKKQK